MNHPSAIRLTSPGRLLAGLALGLSLLAAPAVWAQGRYTISASGTEVTDTRTGLIWQRCSAGQSWSGGTCSGSAATYTHEAALAYAQSQSGWRLPNVKELASLADRSRLDPAIDADVFPGTPSYWYWSSSPVAGYADRAWGVVFDNGYFSSYNRGNDSHVRLVR